MEANELMIDDWVYIEDGDQPNGLSLTKVCSIGLDNTSWLHPIPLTEEILKENGWTEFYYGHFEDENHRHFHRGFDRRLELSLIKGGNCFCTNFSLGRIDFYYVHELQHALRLCGLDELANNFKVE